MISNASGPPSPPVGRLRMAAWFTDEIWNSGGWGDFARGHKVKDCWGKCHRSSANWQMHTCLRGSEHSQHSVPLPDWAQPPWRATAQLNSLVRQNLTSPFHGDTSRRDNPWELGATYPNSTRMGQHKAILLHAHSCLHKQCGLKSRCHLTHICSLAGSLA